MPERIPLPSDLQPVDDPNAKPWRRRPGEGSKAYAAFKTFCHLGLGRSVIQVKVARQCSYNLVKQWSSKWQWSIRAAAWDNRMADVEQEREEKVKADHAEKWERRRQEAAEANWDRAQRLGLRVEEMLKSPLYEQEIDQIDPKTGQPVTIILTPAKWTFSGAAAMFKIAAELQAAALAEALGGQDDGFDPITATPEECRAYLEKQGGMKALPSPKEKGE